MTALEQLTPRESEDLPKLAEYLRIPPRYHHAKVTDFDDMTRKRAGQAIAHEGAMLLGGVGSGKTHLAAALILEAVVAERVLDRDAYVAKHPDEDPNWIARQTLFSPLAKWVASRYRFASIPELAQRARDAARDGELSDVIAGYSEPDLLVLDDLGASRDSEFLEDALYLVVSRRYNNKLPTIYTTNLSLEVLAQRIGERIVSRINGTCMILDLGNVDRRAVA
jgi:DNA replication protein DnaC